MSGHGWVKQNPDGMKARCGGPEICTVCQDEARQLETERITTRKNWHNIAKFAYEAYVPASGMDLPEFDNLHPKIQRAWYAAVQKAVEVTTAAALA